MLSFKTRKWKRALKNKSLPDVWHRPVISAFRRLKKEDYKLKASLCYPETLTQISKQIHK
jgi:hypothetical protein